MKKGKSCKVKSHYGGYTKRGTVINVREHKRKGRR